MAKEEKEKTCWGCAYRQAVPGNAHISCVYNWIEDELTPPAGHAHGIARGWYIFPALFDPTWMLDECPAWSTQREAGKWAGIDPLRLCWP